MAEGFAFGSGRVGRGVYFYEGETEEAAIEAAKIHAAGRLRAMGAFETPAVLQAELHIQNLLDLGSKENYYFVKRMQKQLEKYAYKCGGRH